MMEHINRFLKYERQTLERTNAMQTSTDIFHDQRFENGFNGVNIFLQGYKAMSFQNREPQTTLEFLKILADTKIN